MAVHVQPAINAANDFIEEELDLRARSIEDHLSADILTLSCNLLGGLDDFLRDIVEGRDPKRDRLAVILTTHGGVIEVVHRIVDLIRHHYDYVEFIVPNHAFSAGTVLAMSGDAIKMDYYSRLGPIDPQVERDGRMLPALGYLAQYERLLHKAQRGELTTVEAELMISGFDQAELYAYEHARELSVELLKSWLADFKFKNWTTTQSSKTQVTQKMREERAESIARKLSDSERWHSHGYGISIDVLRQDLKLLIDDFGADQELNSRIKAYYYLMEDYQAKLGIDAIHSVGRFVPLHRQVP